MDNNLVTAMSVVRNTEIDLGRRGFLRGRPRPVPTPQRPPWALPEAAFVPRCTRCGECASACPTGVIVSADGGYPGIDFSRGECTFCGACVEACRPRALQRTEGSAPWTLRAGIGDACLARNHVVCRSCGDICEAGAIRFRPRLGGASLPELDAQRCSGCGACVAPCPGAAIAMTAATTAVASRET